MEDPDQDYHNFSTSSSHRLPTISGTQALLKAAQESRPIPTSLPTLDELLMSSRSISSTLHGLPRGVVTEVYGPPGVGKTTFALQLAVNAIYSHNDGSKVTWIDTSSPLVASRLHDLVNGHRYAEDDPPSSPPQADDATDKQLKDCFNYMQVTTLHKLLALFIHPTPAFPPPRTTLVVLDDLSNLILSSLPRASTAAFNAASQQTPTSMRNDHFARQASSRRFQTMSSFATALQKFAATHNVAVLTTSKATMNLRAGQKAALRPALSSQQWDSCLSVRILLFRDMWPDDISSVARDEEGNIPTVKPSESGQRFYRCAQIVRLGGRDVLSAEVGFIIEHGGIRELTSQTSQDTKHVIPLNTQNLPILSDSDDDEVGVEAGNDHGNDFAEDLNPGDLPEVQVQNKDHELSKRKAAEIADSEDENDNEQLQLGSPPANMSFTTSLQPALQEFDAEQAQPTVTFQTAKKLRADPSDKQDAYRLPRSSKPQLYTRRDLDEDDEMLLEHEAQVPAFSQIAAELSDPLTPSDDDRRSP